MICADPEMVKGIASRLRARSEAITYHAGTEALCNALLETVDNATFPGALIPDQSEVGEFLVVAVALPADWRRLCPVLQAFAGPSLTSFDGLPSTEIIPPDLRSAIAEVGSCVTTAIRIPADPAGRERALRALVAARDTFARAPSLARAAPEPTSWLLARFQDYLNVGRRDMAFALLHRLRDELRLDALNLRFLEVQLLASFDEWAGIVNLPGFVNLTRARRTPAMTGLLLEALYQVYLASPFENDDRASVEHQYAQRVRALAAPMLKTPIATGLRPGGWRIVALEVLSSTSRTDLGEMLAASRTNLGWLGPLLPVHQDAESTLHQLVPALGIARDRLLSNETTESVDATSEALIAVAQLSNEQPALAADVEPFHPALFALEQEIGGETVPTSWSMWMSHLNEPTFTNSLALARLGADEWSISDEAADPTQVAKFLEELNKAQNDELAAERTAQALPYLVSALRQDPFFPNPGMTKVYSGLLTLFALGSPRGNLVYDSILNLVDALLSVGVNAVQYREIIADVNEITGEGVGTRMAYWLLEMVETFMRSSAPDSNARDQFIQSLLARLLSIRTRLSCLQNSAIDNLSNQFGWHLEKFSGTENAIEDSLSKRLAGKTIVIYSLVENASRQAKAALQELSPELCVYCSADQVGSAQLRALAISGDLFVIAWGAAKHAATDFIRTHRAGRPLVYAQGKGFSSLLRAVEDHFISKSGN